MENEQIEIFRTVPVITPFRKTPVVNSLVHRIISLSEQSDFEQDLHHVKHTLRKNNNCQLVPDIIIRRLNPHLTVHKNKIHSSIASLSHHKVTDHLGKGLHKHNVSNYQ